MPLTFEPGTLLTAGAMIAAIAGGWVALSWRIRRLEEDRKLNAATRKQLEAIDGRLKGQGERIGEATAKANNLLGKWEGFAAGWMAAERRTRRATAPAGLPRAEAAPEPIARAGVDDDEGGAE
jgi:hypothetical protein